MVPASLQQVDPVTIRRRLAESGSSYRHHLPDDELLAQLQAVSDIQGQGRADGFRTGQAALMAHAGLRPSRQQVLDVRRAHDPDANEARQERVLRRRPYDVQTAMELWHFDSKRSVLPNILLVCLLRHVCAGRARGLSQMCRCFHHTFKGAPSACGRCSAPWPAPCL